jgi:hypothetical protein
MLRAWLLRLLGTIYTRRSDQDLSAAIDSQLQLHVEDNVRDASRARQDAGGRLGG